MLYQLLSHEARARIASSDEGVVASYLESKNRSVLLEYLRNNWAAVKYCIEASSDRQVLMITPRAELIRTRCCH